MDVRNSLGGISNGVKGARPVTPFSLSGGLQKTLDSPDEIGGLFIPPSREDSKVTDFSKL